jgi:hypothetical protein
MLDGSEGLITHLLFPRGRGFARARFVTHRPLLQELAGCYAAVGRRRAALRLHAAVSRLEAAFAALDAEVTALCRVFGPDVEDLVAFMDPHGAATVVHRGRALLDLSELLLRPGSTSGELPPAARRAHLRALLVASRPQRRQWNSGTGPRAVTRLPYGSLATAVCCALAARKRKRDSERDERGGDAREGERE